MPFHRPAAATATTPTIAVSKAKVKRKAYSAWKGLSKSITKTVSSAKQAAQHTQGFLAAASIKRTANVCAIGTSVKHAAVGVAKIITTDGKRNMQQNHLPKNSVPLKGGGSAGTSGEQSVLLLLLRERVHRGPVWCMKFSPDEVVNEHDESEFQLYSQSQ